mmetsp:Transcript_23939/g.47606  ORF Transcript_23939/g.47606 Transcript_23939/m.47606 type:complete len:140 (+) Transcript_23939:544-963(+)
MDVLSVGRDGVPVDETAHIVDFGGGTGSLALALAVLLPRCTVTVVDLKKNSLDYARERSRQCWRELSERAGSIPEAADGGLPNLTTWMGDIAEFSGTFDVGVALHVSVTLKKTAVLFGAENITLVPLSSMDRVGRPGVW